VDELAVKVNPVTGASLLKNNSKLGFITPSTLNKSALKIDSKPEWGEDPMPFCQESIVIGFFNIISKLIE
jgi:hypothetical protein